MLVINSNKELITVGKLAYAYNCSARTIYRNMDIELKKEKETLNKQIYEKV
jgi:predicted DNA-binding transcriptional regulator YafY